MSDRPIISAEGKTLGEAIAAAAAELGVPAAQVQHKLDADHFRNQHGARTGVSTVKIFARVRDPGEFAGGEAARAFLAELVAKMDIEARVAVRVRPDQHADLRIDSEKARFLVGKQGRTLKAIRHLLAESVGRDYPDWTYHLEVSGGDRDRDDRGGGRERERDDRRGGRGRDRDRDDRGGGRGRERSDADVESLKRLGRKVALHVKATGQAEVIRKRLNSFERRVVHLAVKEIDGIGSQSVKHDDEKRIEVYVLDEDVVGEE